MLTKREAKARLTRRYKEQAAKFPALLDAVPLNVYLLRNWRHVAKRGMLNDYRGICHGYFPSVRHPFRCWCCNCVAMRGILASL